MTEQRFRVGNYTPSTKEVREAYALAEDEIGYPVIAADQVAEFDRWLAEHDAQMLRDFARRVRAQWAPETCTWVGALDDEADRIEEEQG